MGVRSRGSRVLAVLALIAATSLVFSAVSGVWPSLPVARSATLRVTLGLRAAVGGIALPRPSHLMRLASGSRTTRAMATPQSLGLRTNNRRIAVSLMLGLVVVAAKRGWLDFACRSSRTRGQPREGALVV